MDINLFLAVVDLINRFYQEHPVDPRTIGQRRAGYDARLATDILAALEPINKKIAAGEYNLDKNNAKKETV